MGLGAAFAYTVYILVGDRVVGDVPPVALAALVCTGATATFAVAAVVRGGPQLGFGAAGWGWIGAIALVSTVAAILAFFAGLRRVGPRAAAILSTLEPVVTVGLAAAAFGETLGAVQLLGGALVLGAVVVMQWPARQAGVSASVPAPRPAVPAPLAAISATPSTSRPRVLLVVVVHEPGADRAVRVEPEEALELLARSSCRPRPRSRARPAPSPTSVEVRPATLNISVGTRSGGSP